MASQPLPAPLLQWFQRVLTGYSDPQRVLADVAPLLLRFPSLSPRTEVLTYNNGSSELLLNLFGTLPTTFRGVTYNFPLSIWVPRTYPQTPPTLFVTASPGMLISPGNHVDLSGRCYHPYLANWSNNVERSNLVDLCDVFKGVFSRETPVYSKGAEAASTPKPINSPPPPPPKPPKPSDTPVADDASARGPASPPPLPPLPEHLRGRPGEPGAASPHPNLATHHPHSRPLQPLNAVAAATPPPLPPHPSLGAHMSSSHPTYSAPPSLPQSPQSRGPPINPWKHSQHLQYSTPTHPQYHPPAPQVPSPKRPPPQDILDAPDNLPARAIPLTPPQLPPNPEKDRVLQQIRDGLAQIAQQSLIQNAQRLTLTNFQREAMLKAEAAMEAELSSLQRLQEDCAIDTGLLSERIRMAEHVITQARTKELPDVDTLLTATSIVHNQLYDLICEDKAIQDCIYMLAKLLDRSRGKPAHWEQIIWQVRQLAREQFLLRATAKKIADLVGLHA